jgi:hypothetical protein
MKEYVGGKGENDGYSKKDYTIPIDPSHRASIGPERTEADNIIIMTERSKFFIAGKTLYFLILCL